MGVLVMDRRPWYDDELTVFPGKMDGEVYRGITLRTYIATAVLVEASKGHRPEEAADLAVEYADALIDRLE